MEEPKTFDQVIDEVSFTSLFNTYWKKLYLICLHHVDDEEKARDMVQDIFRFLWENRSTVVIRGPWENYLARAAKYKVCEFIRNKVIQEQAGELLANEGTEVASYTEQEILFGELSRHVDALVGGLSHQCKQVYTLSQERGMSNREIASKLHISEKTVSYHLSKAKELLQQRLLNLYQV